MKQGIHPEYKPTTIVCSCGNEIETRSTQEEIHVEICSVCHPFYTGRQKLVDTAGRVERFKRKYGDVGGGAAEEDEEDREVEASATAEEADAGTDAEEEPEERTAAPRAVGAPASAKEDSVAEESGPEEGSEAEEDQED